MKKISIYFIIIMMIMFPLVLSGCKSHHNTGTVKNGTYVMEHDETEKILIPHVTISNDDIIFAYDLLSSYMPHGTYSTDDDILTMTTDDRIYNFVFQIDGDNLIFQKDESSPVIFIDSRFGVKVTDKAKFHLIKDDKPAKKS